MEIINAVLPVVTFMVGFVMSYLLEKRRSEKKRIETSILSAIKLLNEWQEALDQLVVACGSARKSEDVGNAIATYRTKRAIATRLEFELYILNDFERAKDIVHIIRSIVLSNAKYEENNLPAFEYFDAIAKHKIGQNIMGMTLAFRRMERTGGEEYGIEHSAAFITMSEFYKSFQIKAAQATKEASILLRSLT